MLDMSCATALRSIGRYKTWMVQMVYGSLWQSMAMGLSWSHIVSTSGYSSKNPSTNQSVNLIESQQLWLQHIHQDTCMPRSLVVVAVVAAGSVPVPLSDLSEERPGSDR